MDLKLKFAVAISAILSVLLSGFCGIVYLQVKHRLIDSAREALNEHVEHEIRHLTFYKNDEQAHSSTLTDKEIFYSIWKDKVLVKSNFPAHAPISLSSGIKSGISNGILVKYLTQSVGSSEIKVLAYSDLQSTNRYLSTLRTVLVIGWVLSIILLCPLSWLITRFLLRPFNELAAQTQQLDARSLTFRFKEPAKLDEFGRLVRSFNSLLTRLEESFRQIRRFAANASHEFRTPLTVIRGEAELMLRKNRTLEEYQTSLGKILAQTTFLQRTMNGLLFLSDVERLEKENEKVSIRIDNLVSGIVEALSSTPETALKKVVVSGDAAIYVGHQELLSCILSNLIENAAKFSRNQIWIEWKKNGSELRFSIEDDGDGIPSNQRDKMFEPLSRGYHPSPVKGHGLGLAIVKTCVDSLAGQIILGESAYGGLSVRINLMDRAESRFSG